MFSCLVDSIFLLVYCIVLRLRFLPFTIGSPPRISFMVTCTLSSKLHPKSINSVSFLITSVLNCASDRWVISWLLKRMSPGGLICSVENIFFLVSPFFFFPWSGRSCYVGGRSLRCSLGLGTPVTRL
ncbi:hypothetical protein HJG60_009323 [Phyllostomus discolor]|uniref:Uncharacterized protein n=1 Tax=Phyllostomus discolor TaxID=89673 RepID=A0A833Y8S7_9CHIR|nr:hypothetical protein HJG60_009323 [Phyllostomus discolor]